jgi:peptidoglycan/LPS O-acetylase OafA/YrhL
VRHTPELDGIRGWACGSVLIAHCLTGIVHPSPDSWIATFNQHTIWLFLSGVDLFFVLSGFLIGGILLDSRDAPHYFWTFWIRRIGRIFPVAYLVLATYAAALFVTAHFDITRFDSWLLAEYRPPLWSFATFTQSLPIALHGFSGPRWMAMTWSLAIEEQFYVLFPIAVYFLPRKRLVALIVIGLVVAPILRDVFERIFLSWYSAYVLLPSRMDSLMYGVGVALIVRHKGAFQLAERYSYLIDAVALLFFYLIVTNWVFALWPGPSGGFFPLKQSLFAVMWAIVILRIFTCKNSPFNKIWRSTLLSKIGLISYGLYMYHQAINGLMHGILFSQQPTIATLAQLVAAVAVMAIAIGLATISYVYFEKPIRRYAAARAEELSVPARAQAFERKMTAASKPFKNVGVADPQHAGL